MANKLTSTDRSKFAEKFMELGNMILAALTIGQVLSSDRNAWVAVGGVGLFVVLYFVAYQILRRG